MTRSITFITAVSGDMPCRMNSTTRNAPQTLMFASPRPVDPAAPTSLSQYWPAPMIGESPTRPGIFHDSPLVVVQELMSPLAFTAFMLIVPYEYGTPFSSYQTCRPANVDGDSSPPAGGRGGGFSQASPAFSVAFQRR